MRKRGRTKVVGGSKHAGHLHKGRGKRGRKRSYKR